MAFFGNKPFSFAIPMTAGEFMKLCERYKSPQNSPNGTITTPDITAVWAYNGSTVVISVTEFHSVLAKHASVAAIEEHIREALV